MIGEAYFELRARLGRSLSSLLAVAHDVDAEPASRQWVQDLSRDLEDPLLFVAIGEAGVGKSSFLDALFGREFSKIDLRMAPERIRLFKYGAREQTVEAGPHLLEAVRPHRFLKDFHVVDTPGTKQISREQEKALGEYLDRADFVLLVLPVVNPWSGPAWDFIERTRGRWFANLVFVIQRADLREPVEIDAVARHLERTAQERLGRSFPIFAVSARKGLDAKSGALDAGRLLAESGLPALEDHIDERIERGARIEKLRSACRFPQALLEDLMAKARAESAALQEETRKLGELGLSLAERREQSLRQVGVAAGELAQLYDALDLHAGELLREGLRIGQAMNRVFRRADWQRRFEADLDVMLGDSTAAPLESALELIDEDLQSLGAQVGDVLKEHFSGQIDGLPPDLIERRNALLRGMEPALAEEPEAPGSVAAGMALRARAEVIEVVRRLASSSGLAAVVGSARIRTQFRTELQRKRQEALEALESRLKEAVDGRYQRLEQILEPLRAFFTTQQQVQRPVLERAETVRTALQGIATDAGHRGN